MQTFIHILITLVLLFWPILFMMSPMMFDAPGSDNNKFRIVNLMLILCYPIGLFILLWLFDKTYFGFSGLTLAIISSLVITILFSLFGYFTMLFNLQKGIANTGYSVVDNNVYFAAKLVEGADSESFKPLKEEASLYFDSDYALDQSHLYYSGEIVKDALLANLKQIMITGDTYLKNDTQIIYRGSVLAKAEPDNFGGFDDYSNWTYSANKDQYLVYHNGLLLPSIDKNTFEPLSDFIAKDAKTIFVNNHPVLPQADPSTFKLLNDNDFAKDKEHLYYLATIKPFIIKDIDPESFEVLERGYLKDKKHVYVVHQYESIEKLEVADVSTFEATQYEKSTKSEARDINHYYYDGKIVGDR